MFTKKIIFFQLTQVALLLAALPLQAQWSVAQLSEPRERPYPVVSGSKVLFALGSIGRRVFFVDEKSITDEIQIYNASDNSWTTATLSELRGLWNND